MPKSVLEAIKLGLWDFEPPAVEEQRYAACDAMPGTGEKVAMLAARVQGGLPLWHSDDRSEFDESPLRKPR